MTVVHRSVIERPRQGQCTSSDGHGEMRREPWKGIGIAAIRHAQACPQPAHSGRNGELFLVLTKGNRWPNKKTKPSDAFRIGSISGRFFESKVDGDAGKRTIRNVSLQRGYKEDDEVNYSSSFGIRHTGCHPHTATCSATDWSFWNRSVAGV